jgi:hypothetical protein
MISTFLAVATTTALDAHQATLRTRFAFRLVHRSASRKSLAQINSQ